MSISTKLKLMKEGYFECTSQNLGNISTGLLFDVFSGFLKLKKLKRNSNIINFGQILVPA